MAEQLSSAAQEGRTYTNSSKVTAVKTTIADVTASLSSFISPIESTLGSLNDNMDSVSEYMPIAYIFVLTVAVVFFIVYGFMIFVLYK